MTPISEPLTKDFVQTLIAPDSLDMLGLVKASPARGRACLAIGRATPFRGKTPAQVLVCGMGGSGSSGDLLAAIADQAKVPVLVNKSAALPAWVGPETLVIGVSYSGQTYETLSCVREALHRGAQLLGLGSGGELAELAQQHGFDMLRIEGGLPPRSALFDMLFALLGSLESASFLGLNSAEVDAGLAALERLSDEWMATADTAAPLPLQIAKGLTDSDQIVLWGVSGGSEVVPLRWKNQFAENAKTFASVSLQPELNHNEVVAMCARHHSRTRLISFTLEAEVPTPEAVSLELVRPHLQHVTSLHARGKSRLERLLHLVYLGDYTSVYLALLTSTDPTPIAAIDELKRRMASS